MMDNNYVKSATGILDTLMSYLETIEDKEVRNTTAQLIYRLKVKVVYTGSSKNKLIDFINLVPSVSYRENIVATLHKELSNQSDTLEISSTLQEEFEKKQKEVYNSLEEDLGDPQIDNPTHYQSMVAGLDIDAITCMRAAFGDNDVKAFCLCNSLKYIFRSSSKGQNQSIAKAIWYLNKFLELGGYE